MAKLYFILKLKKQVVFRLPAGEKNEKKWFKKEFYFMYFAQVNPIANPAPIANTNVIGITVPSVICSILVFRTCF
jgi:hypothetical protein